MPGKLFNVPHAFKCTHIFECIALENKVMKAKHQLWTESKTCIKTTTPNVDNVNQFMHVNAAV